MNCSGTFDSKLANCSGMFDSKLANCSGMSDSKLANCSGMFDSKLVNCSGIFDSKLVRLWLLPRPIDGHLSTHVLERKPRETQARAQRVRVRVCVCERIRQRKVTPTRKPAVSHRRRHPPAASPRNRGFYKKPSLATDQPTTPGCLIRSTQSRHVNSDQI